MMNQLLIHVIIILFPIFINQFFYATKRSHARNNFYYIMNGLLFGLSSVLCMSLSITVIDGFEWDLRIIPIILAILYGGRHYWSGITALAMMFVFRIAVGGDDIVFALAVFILFALPCFWIAKSFYAYSPKKRVYTGIWLTLYSNAIISCLLFFYASLMRYELSLKADGVIHFIMMELLSFFSIIVASLLYENMIEKQAMRHELEQNEKLKIVSQLAASVAHEVRNPLTVVKGFLQLFKENADESKKNYLQIALSELERAELIITDYLNLAKPHSEHLETVYVPDFLHHTVEMMYSYGLIKNVEIKLVISFADKELYITADKTKLSQVIINLIKNGVEAITKSGTVTVSGSRDAHTVVIEVADTGAGMSEETIANIGTPFFTTKESGTGLGTLVSIRIVEAMSGKISFASKPGKGTTVTLKFPAVTPIDK
ncbi:ATP-binding protein [Paenibacillus harenae]|uniref:ATP-binding protein n=1 Tax=Paenibacillus harenae TaxID=306543 RepID=UPI0027D89CC7|nr:sensor histidine kinase [Paenibacillus harenae]